MPRFEPQQIVRIAKIATIAASVAPELGALPLAHVSEFIAVLRKRLPLA